MESYAVDNKPVLLLKRAADIFSNGEAVHHKMMLFCQSNGFQGHKRLHRMKSSGDRCNRIEIENYIIDMFGDVIEVEKNFTMPTITDLPSYLNEYLKWEIYVYKQLNEIGNELILGGYKCENNLISCHLEDVRKEIEKIRRWITEFSLTNWDMSYILIKDKELHDKIKEIE